jgi:hypothetical protein
VPHLKVIYGLDFYRAHVDRVLKPTPGRNVNLPHGFLDSGSYPMSRAELKTTSKVLKLCSAAATNGLIAPKAPTNIPPALTVRAIP